MLLQLIREEYARRSSEKRQIEELLSQKKTGKLEEAKGAVGNEEKCVVCFEEIKRDRTILDSCAHVYHYFCITTWLKTTNKCPSCRQVPIQATNESDLSVFYSHGQLEFIIHTLVNMRIEAATHFNSFKEFVPSTTKNKWLQDQYEGQVRITNLVDRMGQDLP